MIDPSAPATHPPAADQVLDVELELEPGTDRPDTLFGVAVIFDDAETAIPPLYEPTLLDNEPELTAEGRIVATLVAEELRSWKLTHAGDPPAAIRLRLRLPPPWTTAGHRAAAQAAANLDRRGLPTTHHQSSRTAAELARRHAGDQRRRVLRTFGLAGDAGVTDDAVAIDTGLVPNRVATRRKELQEDHLVELVPGEYRQTRSDTPARVHRITDLGRQVWSILG